MPSTCMLCGKEITTHDLGAKTCATLIEREKNPFCAPIVVCETIHASSRLCGQCAKKHDDCPFCHGILLARKEITNALFLRSIAEEEFTRRDFSGIFSGISITKNQISILYLRNKRLAETFWMEI